MDIDMEAVTIWYLTDNEEGVKLRDSIKTLGIRVANPNGFNLKNANISGSEINLFIFDLQKTEIKKLLESISSNFKIQSSPKFILLSKKSMREAVKLSFNTFHLEFICRPVCKREFLLLIEKTVIVERYREIMKYISREAEIRLEAFEGLLDINRNEIFKSKNEKVTFEKIVKFEKNLMREQTKLNNQIKGLAILRRSDLFDMRQRINAEEMLGDLRRRELMEAKNIIEAQESVINFSSQELRDAKRIIDAKDNVEELGRNEALEMKEIIEKENKMNKSLSEEIDRLLAEVGALKSRLSKYEKV